MVVTVYDNGITYDDPEEVRQYIADLKGGDSEILADLALGLLGELEIDRRTARRLEEILEKR